MAAGLEADTDSEKEMDVEGSVVTVEVERAGEGDAEGAEGAVDVREAAAAALAAEGDS